MSIQRWRFRRIWALLGVAWIALWAWPTVGALHDVLDAHRSVLAARREARLEAANRSRDPLARAEDHALRNYRSAQGPATFSLAVAERGLALRKTRLAERVTWLVGGPVATGAAALAFYVLVRRTRRPIGGTSDGG